MNNALYQFIALNPYSIEKYEDWLKISPFLGQSHGNFIARLPKKWLSLLNDHITDININGWGQEEQVLRATSRYEPQARDNPQVPHWEEDQIPVLV